MAQCIGPELALWLARYDVHDAGRIIQHVSECQDCSDNVRMVAILATAGRDMSTIDGVLADRILARVESVRRYHGAASGSLRPSRVPGLLTVLVFLLIGGLFAMLWSPTRALGLQPHALGVESLVGGAYGGLVALVLLHCGQVWSRVLRLTSST